MASVTFEHPLAHTSFSLLFSATLSFWGGSICTNDSGISFLRERGMVVAHFCTTGFLPTRWIHSTHLPLSNLYESSMFLSWSLTLIHIISRVKNGNDWLGAVTAPSAMSTHGFATLGLPKGMQESIALVPALQSHWLVMHVTTIVLSYATLLCGSSLAITLLIVTAMERMDLSITKYRNHPLIHWDLFRRYIGKDFDPEESHKTVVYSRNLFESELSREIDNWSYRMIGLGFPPLTLGILSGAVWANETWGSYRNWDPKETWALITWFIFAIYLHIRIVKGWQGKEPAIVATLGSFVVRIRYLGVNSFGRGLHSYGWWL
uniref:Cytochrome c biogenesis protein CcsA n=1 Tax=Haplomitrium blumei TaxID=258993 RepID=A0A4Y5P7V0_9MARC|nr:CcsA [Haplomitrium blumei]QCW59377.1 CcsA [Haplomitrium blumei]